MPQLNQIIALVNGAKGRAESDLTAVYHKLQADKLLVGLTRTYQPRDEEDGEFLPPESQRVQLRVKDALTRVAAIQTRLFDLVATQDYSNTDASASVVVDGKVILADVPVTHLLFLEKQLADLQTVVSKVPTLDPAYDWSYSEEADCMVTPPKETIKNKKVFRNHVQAEATKEHPAQVETYTEDVPVGTWTQILHSGAIPESERNAIRDRVRALRDAVVSAREQANTMEVTDTHVGEAIFGYVLNTGAQA